MTSSDDALIHFVCEKCQARLKVPSRFAASRHHCPRCRALIEIPAEVPAPDAAAADDAYEVWTGEGLPPASLQTYIPVICRVCRTRMYGTEDQVGRSIQCPDCRADNIVPPPPAKQRKIPVETGEATYGVGQPEEVFKPVTVSPGWTFEHARLSGAIQREPPRWPLVLGIVTFPFYLSVWPLWLIFSLGGAVLVLLLRIALTLSSIGGFAAVGTVLLLMVVSVLGGLWAAAVLAWFLAIIEASADGEDRLSPGDARPWVDLFIDARYFVSSLFFAGLPGAILWGLPLENSLRLAISAGIVFVLFPPVSLSTLETGSAVMPFSRPIWKSLLKVPWAWALFYLEAGLDVALAGLLLRLARNDIPGGLFLQTVVVMGTAVIYVRLVGRLAYVCAERTSPEEKARSENENGGRSPSSTAG